MSIFFTGLCSGGTVLELVLQMFFRNALSLPVPMYELPLLLIFPMYPFPDPPSWQPLQTHQAQTCTLLVDVRSLVRLIHQLFHLHQMPCVLAPIPFGSCYVLPISPGWDGGLRLIWNLSGAVKGLDGCLTVRKNKIVPAFVALLCILHYTNPIWVEE